MSDDFIIYPEVGKKYRHYKGGLYEIISLAKHSETNEDMVVYKSLLFGSVYVRPLSMWFEIVKHSSIKFGYDQPRFTLSEK